MTNRHIDSDCEVARGVGWMCTCRTPEEKADDERKNTIDFMTPERLAQLRQFANYVTYHVPVHDVRFTDPNPPPAALRDADAGDDMLELCAVLDAFLVVEHDNAERMRRGVPPPPPPAVFDWDSEKNDRDSRPQFSQLDIDATTKPLHAEIERLKEYHRGYEACEVCRKATQNGVWCCDGCLETVKAELDDWRKAFGMQTAESAERERAALRGALEKAQLLNEYFRDAVGECHVMISRNTSEYQIRREWDATELPPRLQKVFQRVEAAELVANRLRLSWREDTQAERERAEAAKAECARLRAALESECACDCVNCATGEHGNCYYRPSICPLFNSQEPPPFPPNREVREGDLPKPRP